MTGYREADDSTVTHHNKVYSVNELLAIAETKQPQTVAISDLAWILKYDQPDPQRVEQANTSHPLIVLRESVRMIVMDGLHRLCKLYNSGAATSQCIVLDEGDLPEPLWSYESS